MRPTSYPLRLPPDLDAIARERCKRLGISLNALIAVALDDYLSRVGKPAAKRPAAVAKKPARVVASKPSVGDDVEYADDGPGERPDWRFFHPDPDMWPFVDPDPAWKVEAAKFPDSPDAWPAIEAAYWSTRQRPGK